MAFQILLAGQDITLHTDESSIDITDTLGQGAGTGSITAGRATECTFLTDLGPISSAIGAGQSTPNDYLATILADNPAVLYQLQETSGSTLVDSGSRGLTGQYYGGYALQQRNVTPGRPTSKSVFFDGVSGSFARANSVLTHSTTNFTFELGFTFPDSSDSGFNRLLGTDNPGATNKGWEVGFHNSNADNWFFNAGNGTTNVSASYGTGASSPGTLFHVIGTYDGTTLKLYLNGALVASHALTGPLSLGTAQLAIAASTFGEARVDIAFVSFYDGVTFNSTKVTAHYKAFNTTPVPTLVRQGEVVITDASGNCIFGGYATNYQDATTRTKVYTQVNCHDYWQHLDRIIVNEVYDGQSDIFIIKDLLTKYATWIDTSLLPTTSSYNFGPRNFTHFTLQKALQNVVDATGFAIWLDYNKKIHYTLPTNASTAPFGLSSSPNFSNTFPVQLVSHERDDTAAINRVYFYGGKNLSKDYTQDLSIQANGVATTFTLAYYPHKASDEHFHVYKNGTEYNDVNNLLGFVGGNGASNTLIKDGGSCQVLLNIDSHTLEWNTAPALGATVSAKYRHEVPLVVVITDEASHQFYGTYLDGVISDSSVFDSTTAVQRCRIVLLEQSFGLETLQVKCWKAGLQAGQLLSITESVRSIKNTYIIQKVEVKSLGKGNFEYTVDLGAWRWDLVDILMQSARAATPSDDSADSNTTPLNVQQVLQTVHVVDAVTKTTYTTGNFTYDTGAQVGHYGLSTYA